MWSPVTEQTTPDDRKTFQEILDTLTRPNKWARDPLTAASGSLATDRGSWAGDGATWTGTGRAGADMDGSSLTGRATSGAVTHEGPAGFTLVTASLPGTPSPPVTAPDANTAPDFWYRYGISITVAILVFAVVLVLVIQCRILCQKNSRRRRLVDLAGCRSSNKAREDIFESFHRQEAAQASVSSRLQSGASTTQEDIPMRVLHDTQPCHHQLPWRAPPAGRAAEPLARVFPLSRHGANITDPYLCDPSYHRLWDTTAGVYPIRSDRTVSSEPVIARPTPTRFGRRYASRSRVRRVRVRASEGGPRMPRFNLSGTRVLTSPESNGVHHSAQRRTPRTNIRTTFAEANALLAEINTPTPKLVVPTNTPNTHCTDSAPENASPCGPGLDSDFGASAGIPHFTVSPDYDNSMAATAETSVRDATYDWDTYDPAYMNRTVRYMDGAYFPVLQKRQYWV